MGCGASKGEKAAADAAAAEKERPIEIDSSEPRADIHKDYQLQKKIGSGNYSTVRQAVHRATGEKVAVKVAVKASLTAEDIAAVYVEVDVLKKLDHPNVVKLKAFYEDDAHFYLVMELLTGGELLDEILSRQKYSEAEARRLVETLTRAIQYCHSMGVAHRDLKLENVLLSSPGRDAVVKIADFGFAKNFSSEALSTSCGTPGYVAPEILMSKRAQSYGPQVDIWSLGVIFYILLCGYPPFVADSQGKLFRLIKAGRYSFGEGWSHISEDAKELISHILVVDPDKRYTARQILNHKWLSGSTPVGDENLPEVLSEMRKFNARRKLRRAFHVVKATNRLTLVASGRDRGGDEDESKSPPE